ncbi:DUF4383 domain-containing protein [Amycolatopsis xylanica]|nr:DUF4383 domain-containing protein [Amycolatopsis xylanica]
MTETENRTRRYPPQFATAAVGAVFLLVGVLGFIPGITTGYEDLHFAGPHSGALLFGVLGVLAARSRRGARAFLMIGGGLYLLLWIYGVGVPDHSSADFGPLNSADNWLHLGLGLGMIVLGLVTTALERKHGDYPEPEIQHQ